MSYAVFARSLILAQRALCAAAILRRPAAEIVRGRLGANFGPCPFALAHRFFCARLIFLRAEADNVRRPFSLGWPRAESAAVNRWTSCCALFSSFFKCATAPDMFPIGSLLTRFMIDVLRIIQGFVAVVVSWSQRITQLIGNVVEETVGLDAPGAARCS